LLELVELLSVDQAGFVINVFRDVDAATFFIDFADDGLDRGVALDQDAWSMVSRCEGMMTVEIYDRRDKGLPPTARGIVDELRYGELKS
jgi:hypothetical protein